MSATKDAVIDAMNDRKGDWMQLHSGIHFYPLDPRPDEIDIEDIAHALSLLCRFGGHVRTFYSVAQHCCLVSDLLPERLKLAGLMHDAPEAYVVDIPRPVKVALPDYKRIEHAVESAVCERFGVSFADPQIKSADNCALMTEARDLLSSAPVGWSIKEIPHPHRIFPWSSQVARIEFLKRFAELTAYRDAA